MNLGYHLYSRKIHIKYKGTTFLMHKVLNKVFNLYYCKYYTIKCKNIYDQLTLKTTY